MSEDESNILAPSGSRVNTDYPPPVATPIRTLPDSITVINTDSYPSPHPITGNTDVIKSKGKNNRHVSSDTVNDYDDNKSDGNPFVDIEVIDFDNDPSIVDNRWATTTQKNILDNFLLFSVFFSLNHGGVVSCLSLATARLGGNIGAYQSSALYGSHMIFSLLGATSAVRRLGGAGKGGLVFAMWIYCAYVGCFALATIMVGENDDGDLDPVEGWGEGGVGVKVLVIAGGLLGGVGGGFLWTAQGSYFARVSSEYSSASDVDEYGRLMMTLEDATKELGGRFAAIYMTGELVMRLFSSIAITTLGWSWTTVFLGYTSIAMASALLTSTVVVRYENEKENDSMRTSSIFREATSMLRLLGHDCKMKHFIPFCAVFALVTSFLTSFINGQVLPLALKDTNNSYIGLLGSFTTVAAAIASILFARLAQSIGNRPVMALGCVAFILTSLLFILRPGIAEWGVGSLLVVYGLQGVGRATFEGNLRAEFAVMFARDKEGAFANIVFWKGLFGAIGFSLTANLGCSKVSTYCIEYQDGSLHEILIYELGVLTCAVLAVGGLARLTYIRRFEEKRARQLSMNLNMRNWVT